MIGTEWRLLKIWQLEELGIVKLKTANNLYFCSTTQCSGHNYCIQNDLHLQYYQLPYIIITYKACQNVLLKLAPEQG